MIMRSETGATSNAGQHPHEEKSSINATNDTAGCGRSTCSNTGSKTRTITTSSCNTGGGCDPHTTTETDTADRDRSQDGQSCDSTQLTLLPLQYGGLSGKPELLPVRCLRVLRLLVSVVGSQPVSTCQRA